MDSEASDDPSRRIPPAPRPRPAHSPEALAALKKMAKPQPKAPAPPLQGGGAEPAEPDRGGSGSATGFVGMLAKGQLDAGDSRLGMPADETARRRYSLEMAREVVAAEEPGGATARAPQPQTGGDWHKGAAIAAWMLAAMLVVIGAWAVGAMAYMARVTPGAPEEVHYPLIAWGYRWGEAGGYAPASRIVAETMLGCLPVAVALGVMGAAMWRRGRKR